MLAEIFYWVLNMSITAAITGLVVLPVGRIRRFPRRAAVLLWVIPFLRMAVPVGINRPYSLMTLLARAVSRAVVVFEPAPGLEVSMMNSVRAADEYFPLVYKGSAAARVFGAAAVIWLAGAAVMLILLGVLYVSGLREARGAVPGAKGEFYSDKVRSPAVYGIFRPRIVLPAAYDCGNLDYVLRHEREHIRRRDNLWRAAAWGIAAVHWFNPLAWVFLKRLLADMELACDEGVLAGLTPAQAREYARTLLANGERRGAFSSALGGASLRTRIERILAFRPLTRMALAGSLALLAAMFCALMTNAG